VVGAGAGLLEDGEVGFVGADEEAGGGFVGVVLPV
jgi:hypothetical protein